MVLLGFDSGSTQVVEYFEVRNYPLFDDIDKKNPLTQSLLQAILANKDLSSTLIFNLVFRSLSGNVKDFMQYIENGNYFEDFPTIESYILLVDYDEVTDVLTTLNSTPCTIDNAFLRALSKTDWIKYWLQENKEYNIGTNIMGEGNATVTTSPITPATDTVQVTPSTNHFDIAITSEIATSDSVTVDQRWSVNFSTIVYNSTPDTYTVQVYQADGTTMTLPYTVPSRPTQLHYVVTYYRNSTPARQYLFIYKVGTGTYTDLDTVEEPINIENSTIQVVPPVPLRINNANYTTFGTAKKEAIENILKIIHLDAEEIIDGVMDDSGLAPGDLDHVYVNFGVRMWDTSQAGMSYLYRFCENLYPAQGTTKGIYDASPVGDTKPANNILVNTDDNKYAFQFNYITYTFTSLNDIDADSGSVENGIYYSDMSKFDDNDILAYPYFSSSGKGTYNVGYKADNLTEVAAFLAGNGVTNPGTTTSEATNWLQVTERLVYNNTTPVLLDPDGTTSSITYLTPDRVYKNNGSGVLQAVEQASEETTSGQSITYYKILPSGLAAYTMSAPIGAVRVIDGDTGKFKVVKFNLGAQTDLMVPFIHTFTKDLSETEVSKLFLAGAHVSIYVAHYEVIHHAGMSFLEALVIIIIIAVVIYFTWGADGGATAKTLLAKIVAAKTVMAAIGVILTKLATFAFKYIVMQVISLIIAEITDDPTLQLILNLLAMVAVMSYVGHMSYGVEGTDFIGPIDPAAPKSFHLNKMTSFRNPSQFTALDWTAVAITAFDGIGTMQDMAYLSLAEAISTKQTAWDKEKAQHLKEIEDYEEMLFPSKDLSGSIAMANNARRVLNRQGSMLPEHVIQGKLGLVDLSLLTIQSSNVEFQYEIYDAIYV